MQYTTPTEEELILTIATHPQLDSRCWEMIADAKIIGSALEKALANVFPAETITCRQVASVQRKPFWNIVANFVEYGFFNRKEQLAIPSVERLPPLPAKHSSNERIIQISRHPVLGHPWWDGDTIFHEPPSVDNYLLMSHTS